MITPPSNIAERDICRERLGPQPDSMAVSTGGRAGLVRTELSCVFAVFRCLVSILCTACQREGSSEPANTKMLCWQNIPAGHSPTPPLSSRIHRFSRVSWITSKSYHHRPSTRNHIIRSLSIVATWDHFIQEHASSSPGTISSRLVQIAWDHFIQDLNITITCRECSEQVPHPPEPHHL